MEKFGSVIQDGKNSDPWLTYRVRNTDPNAITFEVILRSREKQLDENFLQVLRKFNPVTRFHFKWSYLKFASIIHSASMLQYFITNSNFKVEKLHNTERNHLRYHDA